MSRAGLRGVLVYFSWDSGLSLIVAIEVAGSSPVLRGVVVQLVRIPACHAGGRGFESRPFRQSFFSKC